MKAGRPRLVVGFAAETNDVEVHAKQKLAKKGCDWTAAFEGRLQFGLQRRRERIGEDGRLGNDTGEFVCCQRRAQ